MAKIIVREFGELLQEDYLGYSLKCALDRALVNIYDGLKPSQRRILDTMKEKKVYSLTKSANVEGATMVRHPHGGTYGTMVNMVQPDYQNIPLLTGQGNFGNHTTKLATAAAPRYTEVKLSEFGKFVVRDIGKGYVDTIPNYDGKTWQSEVIPVPFPMCLTQYSSGTAVGFSSTIFSYNLKELTQAIKDWRLEGKKSFLYPDFATGGFVVEDKETLEKINLEGKGSLTLRGKVRVVNKQEIEIYEIPHNTLRETIIQEVVELYKAGKFKEIVDLKDLSGFNKKTKEEELRIWVKIKKGINPDVVIEKLYMKTSLEKKISTNMLALQNRDIVQVGVWDVIEEWYNWRVECIKRFTRQDIEKLEEEIMLFKGIEIVYQNMPIDDLLQIVRFSKKEVAIDKIMKLVPALNHTQADFISDLKASCFNEDWFNETIQSIQPKEKQIQDLLDYIGSEERLQKTVLDDLENANKKFGVPRNTEVIPPIKGKFKEKVLESLEDNSDYHIVITKDNYIYKFKTHNDSPKLKTDDEVKNMLVMNNAKDSLLIFSKSENFAKRIKVKDIPLTERNDLGTFAGTLVEYKPLCVIPVCPEVKYYVNIYQEGRVVKVATKSYQGQQGIKQQNDELTLLDCLAITKDDLSLELTTEKNKTKTLELDKLVEKKDRTGLGIMPVLDIKGYKLY